MVNDNVITMIEAVITLAREDWKGGMKYIQKCQRIGKEPDYRKPILQNFSSADYFLKSLDHWEDIEQTLLEEMNDER